MHDYGPLSRPTNVRGEPTRLQRATVSVLNDDGTVDVRLKQSRANRNHVPVFGQPPALGDAVLLAELDGDKNTPIVLTAAGGGGGGFEVGGFPQDGDVIVYYDSDSGWFTTRPVVHYGINSFSYDPVIPFSGNWDMPFGWPPVFMARNATKQVFLRGVVTNSNAATAPGTVIFNIPAGWRIGPWSQRFIVAGVDITASESANNAAAKDVTVLVKSNGDVVYVGGGTTDSNGDVSFYLAGINYVQIS